MKVARFRQYPHIARVAVRAGIYRARSLIGAGWIDVQFMPLIQPVQLGRAVALAAGGGRTIDIVKSAAFVEEGSVGGVQIFGVVIRVHRPPAKGDAALSS